MSELSFPRQQARTRRFTLGAPRKFTIAPDGRSVVFLRSPGGESPLSSLWAYDVATGRERQVVDVAALLDGGNEELSPEERARRERSRELSGGIVDYACDGDARSAAFTLGGRLWWAALDERGAVTPLPAPPGVVDPRPNHSGELVAFLSGPGLYAVVTSGATEAFLVAGDGVAGDGTGGDVTWGAAEFIAAEEMRRSRGYWWSPAGDRLLAARVDNAKVTTWWTSDPANPGAQPEPHRYPVAGSEDADVSLWLLDPVPGGGERVQVRWDAATYPYLATVHWGDWGPPLLVVERRDHKACLVLSVDTGTGSTTTVGEQVSPAWVSWAPGTPAWAQGGELVWSAEDAGSWSLKVGDELVTPPGMQVAEVAVDGPRLVLQAWAAPEVIEAWAWSREDGLSRLTDLGGVTAVIARDGLQVTVARSMAWHGQRVSVGRPGGVAAELANLAQQPVVDPQVRFMEVGERGLRAGVVLPTGHPPGHKLPVVMAPYGGPGHQQVMAAKQLWLEAQWFADQGFAVVVVDGRGVPGRGPAWEHEVYGDLAGPVLQDQVDGLVGAAAKVPELDLGRVGIKGWSFGGYLAALAVLARPDVFHAAVAGAPVTDWRLYDTYYSERFLGHPGHNPGAYERSSLLPLAAGLSRPLLMVHGLGDDNVYAAHTLALSSSLTQAGRLHSVLPLPGVTHVAGREDVAESLLLVQVDFFARALGAKASG